jgi:hypothetical protein
MRQGSDTLGRPIFPGRVQRQCRALLVDDRQLEWMIANGFPVRDVNLALYG